MLRLVLPLCLIAALLAGCDSAAKPPSNRTLTVPDTLRWGVVGVTDVPTLDPALVSDPVSMSVASLIYGGLVRLDPHLRVQPDAARRWTVSDDGRVYTFFLRPKLRYANGRPVRAVDFARAMERALGPEGAAGAASFYLSALQRHPAAGTARSASGIEVLGPATLRITLARPSAHFLAELAFPASYVPEPGLRANYGDNWTDHAAGFGPYRIQLWQHTRDLTLVRNPYYWGGKPAFHHITLRFFQQADAINAYRRGKLDFVSGLPVGQPLSGVPTRLVRQPALALDYLAFNTTRLPFYRLNVRRAFAATIRPGLALHALSNAVFPAAGILPSDFGLTTPAWRPRKSPATYLALGRYPHAHHFPHIVLVTPHDAGLRKLAVLLATTWQRKLGVTVQVRPLDSSSYNQVLSDRSFDIALVRWGADYADPQDFLGTQLGASPENSTGWSPRRYNRLIFFADALTPADKHRSVLFTQAATLAGRKLPLVPLDEPAVAAIMRPNLTGIRVTGLNTVTGDWVAAGFRA